MVGADGVAAGDRPVDFDVAEHVALGKRAALEAQAQPFADHAVRAVGTHQVPGCHSAAVAEGAGDGVVGLFECSEADSAFDGCSQLGEALGEDALRRVLRQTEKPVRNVLGEGEVDAGRPRRRSCT